MGNILKEISAGYGIKILELAVMPDHVLVLVEVPPSMSLGKASNLLKGRSSCEFFRKHPKLRQICPRGHLWSKGKFYRTTGNVDLESTKNYVRNQIDVHQKTLTD